MKDKDINSLNHTRYRCQYNIVFAPKLRRQVIYREIKVDIVKILNTETVMSAKGDRGNRSRSLI